MINMMRSKHVLAQLFLRPSPPFFLLASNTFPDVGSVAQIEKKNLKKIHKKSYALVPQDDVKS